MVARIWLFFEAPCVLCWADLVTPTPYEDAATLTQPEFLSRYVEGHRPVVLTAPEVVNSRAVTEWGPDYFSSVCGDARTHIMGYRDLNMTAWASLEPRGMTGFAAFMEQLMASNSTSDELYAVDFDIKCKCDSELMHDVQVLHFFRQDLLTLNARNSWPRLWAGPAGSRSGAHVDAARLPFYITVTHGRKVVRTISLPDWQRFLQSVLPHNEGVAVTGGFLSAFDMFNDTLVESLLGSEGVLYEATLSPGDTIYIPYGALHAALNLDTPTIMVSQNFLDRAHLPMVAKDCAENRTFLSCSVQRYGDSDGADAKAEADSDHVFLLGPPDPPDVEDGDVCTTGLGHGGCKAFPVAASFFDTYGKQFTHDACRR